MIKIEIESAQIQGKRAYQQDVYAYRNLSKTDKLFILADGMGGYKGGEIASELALQAFMQENSSFITKHTLITILEKANEKIKKYKLKNSEVNQMGTTLIALLVEENHYYWISVGDSPLYSIRENKIERINQNHSVAGLLDLQVKQGEISEKEAKKDKNRHLLTSALMGEKISMIDVSETFRIFPNEILILASDGLETLSEKEILDVANKRNKNLKEKVQNLLQNVMKKKKTHQDNTTVMMISFSQENREKSLIEWVKGILR